jgi:succinate dehydrogenase hydrophobic anchor subunit
MLLVTAVLYHGSYGLYSIGQDYIRSAGARTGLLVGVTVAALGFAWTGLKLIVQA